ncbi:MAG: hypothetical protein EAZ43_09580 [Betaproteobacteria bacterium]|nr:MAG: hypothetical protein EAZ43_09580 [Betaproteobacteria bacterium]
MKFSHSMLRSLNRFRRTLAVATAAALSVLTTTAATAACPFVGGSWSLTNEGVVVSRYASTITGTPLVANTRLSSLDRVAVKTGLDNVRNLLDMNGDAAITGVDSAIITRYLAGYRGAALTANVSLGNATRDTAQKVLDFIDTGCPAPVGARTPLYEALSYVTARNDLRAQMNAQGARGFQYIGGLSIGAEFFNFYGKDQNANFSYEVLDTVATGNELLTQLNGMGARGYRLDSFLTSGNHYVRDNTANLTYSYELPPAPATSAAFLTQANERGTNGFYFIFTYFIGGTQYAIYGKDTSAATYLYELQPSTDVNVTADDFIVQANARGAVGFKYVTGFFFGDGAKNIYVKDTSQSASFTFKANAVTSTGAALVTQANAEGQLNFAYFSGLIFFPNGYAGAQQARNIYFKPINCAGWLMCTAGGPF